MGFSSFASNASPAEDRPLLLAQLDLKAELEAQGLMKGKQPRYRLSFSKGTSELHGLGDEEADMSPDDLHAMGWIALGSVASAAITTAILVAPVSVPAAPSPEPAYTVAPMAGRAVIDFAIIRGYPETMVGPEGPATGWLPPPADPDARARR